MNWWVLLAALKMTDVELANKLLAQAEELEAEAVQLEVQKLLVAAAAKLQKTKDLRDSARIMR